MPSAEVTEDARIKSAAKHAEKDRQRKELERLARIRGVVRRWREGGYPGDDEAWWLVVGIAEEP